MDRTASLYLLIIVTYLLTLHVFVYSKHKQRICLTIIVNGRLVKILSQGKSRRFIFISAYGRN